MKMRQIALAAAVVAASSAALADVTVYGIADVNVNSSKDEITATGTAFGALAKPNDLADVTKKKAYTDLFKSAISANIDATSQSRIDSSGLSTSRIGFKGSEDLGGGLQASFQLEGKLSVDTGENANYDGGFFGRQSWVGLTGNFGTVQLGKTWTSFDDVAGSFNHADNTNLSVTSAAWGAFGNNYDNNTANQIKYTLPLSNGLTASIGYSFGENKKGATTTAEGNKADNTVSLGVKYAAGPLAVGYAYQTEDVNASGAKGASDTVKDRFNLVGASFDLGSAKLVGSWSDMKSTRSMGAETETSYDTAFTTAALGGTATEWVNFVKANSKATRYQLGVALPMGASNLYFGYADSSESRGGKKIGDANGYVLAATYSLSKRTTAYAGYTTVKATLNANTVYTGQAQISGKSTKTVAGIRHVF
jgi:predicted porin